MTIATATEVQNNFGRYLQMARVFDTQNPAKPYGA